MNGSTTWRIGAAATVAAVSALVVSLGALGAAVPNPCKLVPAATVASTLKLKGPAPSGKLTTRADGAVKQDVCTFAIAGKQLQIDVAPHQVSGGSGGGAP